MRLTIEMNDPASEKYYLALSPELESVPYKKTKSTLAMTGSKSFRITVEGNDLSAIRGTFNSYLNWIKIIEENIGI